MTRLAIVVPAYNAARHLRGVVERIIAAAPAGLTAIVIVDDGSRDETLALARTLGTDHPLVTVVARPRNGGYGAAMKDGLAAARAGGADVVGGVHADGQYSPEALAHLLTELGRRQLDLLQGSRIAAAGARGARAGGMPRYKIAGNWALNQLERRVLRLPLTDFHSGYLIYGARALNTIEFSRLSDSFDFDMEVIASARSRGLAIGEAPIPTHYGDEVSYLNPVTYGLRVLRVMWRFKRGVYA